MENYEDFADSRARALQEENRWSNFFNHKPQPEDPIVKYSFGIGFTIGIALFFVLVQWANESGPYADTPSNSGWLNLLLVVLGVAAMIGLPIGIAALFMLVAQRAVGRRDRVIRAIVREEIQTREAFLKEKLREEYRTKLNRPKLPDNA